MRIFANLALLWLAGLYLRITVLAISPLAPDIADELSLGEAEVGAMTMIPVLLVALGAVPGAWLISRIGVRAALITGLLFMAIMSAARAGSNTALTLLLATALMGLGIAVMQIALPSIVERWAPTHVALGSALYINAMMVGEFAGAGMTLPVVLPMADGDWRIALVLWSLPVIVIAALLLLPARTGRPAVRSSRKWIPDWHDLQIWRLGLLLGGSVVVFYAINAYMGSILTARGEERYLAALFIAFNLSPFLASMMMLVMGSRWTGHHWPLFTTAAVSFIGLSGFIVLNGWPAMFAAVIAGFAATIELILLMSLPPMIVSGAAISRLTAGMTTLGYGIAFTLPLLGGVLADTLESTSLTLMPSLAFAMACVLLSARRNRSAVSARI